MVKLNNSNFEKINDIIEALGITYDETKNNVKEDLSDTWSTTVGEKISKYSKVYDFSADNILTILCSDSIVSNELYYQKETLRNKMNKKIEKLGIVIKDMKFNYRKWEE